MEDVYINYWAILVATVASFAIGALWYLSTPATGWCGCW